MKVGRDLIKDKKTKKDRLFQYKDIPFDTSKTWIDTSQYLPRDFDLLKLLKADKTEKTGWSTGCKWDGIGIKSNDEFEFWKKAEI